jgi:hypothetical protein
LEKQIPEVEYGGKYGHMRANTDICPVFALRTNNLHRLLAIIEHAKTDILQFLSSGRSYLSYVTVQKPFK